MNDNFIELLDKLSQADPNADYVSFNSDFTSSKNEASLACAIANAAMLAGVSCAYRVWGASANKRKVVGTSFDPFAPYKKHRSYGDWLHSKLGSEVDISFGEGTLGTKHVVVMGIRLRGNKPAMYRNQYWLRFEGEVISADPYSTAGQSLERAAIAQSASGFEARLEARLKEAVNRLETASVNTPAPASVLPTAEPSYAEAEESWDDEFSLIETNSDSWGKELESLATTAAEPVKPIDEAPVPEPMSQPSQVPSLTPSPSLGTVKTKLAEKSEKRADKTGWYGSATDELDATFALNLLDWESMFHARSLPIPEQPSGVIELLENMHLVKSHSGSVAITNLGALAAARDLRMFDDLDRLAIQVVIYRGSGRAEAVATKRFDTGYSTAVEAACNWIRSFFTESASTGVVASMPYPLGALREIISNAAVHQHVRLLGRDSFEEQGADEFLRNLETQPASAGPLVEVFSNRIEVSNTGTLYVALPHIANSEMRADNNPLAQTLRFFQTRPTARSGWTSVLESCEMHHAPVPIFSTSGAEELRLLEFARPPYVSENQMSLGDLFNDSGIGAGTVESMYERGRLGNASLGEPANLQSSDRVRVTLRPIVSFKGLTPEQRLIATYWHAFNRYQRDDYLTNGNLRERFEIEVSNSAQVSRLIKEAAQHGLIRVLDPNASPKFKRYIPYWA